VIPRLNNDFLLEAAVLALARWDELSPDEQRRFRVLATKAAGNSAANLDAAELKELRTIWKKVGARKLVRELVRTSMSRPATNRSETPG